MDITEVLFLKETAQFIHLIRGEKMTVCGHLHIAYNVTVNILYTPSLMGHEKHVRTKRFDRHSIWESKMCLVCVELCLSDLQ